jgi:hypothetical protein
MDIYEMLDAALERSTVIYARLLLMVPLVFLGCAAPPSPSPAT